MAEQANVLQRKKAKGIALPSRITRPSPSRRRNVGWIWVALRAVTSLLHQGIPHRLSWFCCDRARSYVPRRRVCRFQ
jgi:hypothetical protein